MKIKNYSLHRVDVHEKDAVKLKLDGSSDVDTYANSVLEELLDKEKNQAFRFHDQKELVPSRILESLADATKWQKNSDSIAKKLHRTEVAVQKNIQAMGQNVTRGGLLQVELDDNHNSSIFVLLKIDDSEFLDEEDGTIRSGLPLKTRVQKAAIVYISKGDISSLILSDSRSRITPYWHEDFLEASPVTSPEVNTKNAFEAIDKLLTDKFKRKGFNEDYWILRNELVYYFRNEDDFVFDDLESKLGKHTPESQDSKTALEIFKNALNSLPKDKKNGFDTQFELKTSEVKLRIKRTFFQDKNFKLEILRDVDDLEGKLSPGEDDVGHYLKVYSKEAYDSFNNTKK